MKSVRTIALATAVFVGAISSVAAQTYGDGLKAYKAKDFATALRVWGPLAENGNPRAQRGVGLIFFKGQGLDPDNTEAVKWFRLSAYQGLPTAQISLGLRHQNGQGAQRSNVLALMWFQLARINGFDRSDVYINGVADKMTTSEIDKAEAMAQTCLDTNYINCEDLNGFGAATKPAPNYVGGPARG